MFCFFFMVLLLFRRLFILNPSLTYKLMARKVCVLLFRRFANAFSLINLYVSVIN